MYCTVTSQFDSVFYIGLIPSYGSVFDKGGGGACIIWFPVAESVRIMMS